MARRIPSKKTRSTVRSEDEALLRRLDEALSDDELRSVLAGALSVLDTAARDRLLGRLEPDTAEALRHALSRPGKGVRAAQPVVDVAGKRKLRQEWNRAWGEWAEVIEQSRDEEGKYVRQDAHWQPPYLDTGSIGDDLDAVASRIHPLIPRVIAEGIAPGFSFAETLEAMDDELFAGLPDWFGAVDDGCQLGPEATSCLLEWEWRIAQRERRDALEFLDDLRDLESRLTKIGLDDRAIKAFVLALPEDQLRAVLESLSRQRRTKRWEDAFTHAYGCWAEILRDLSRRWKPALYAETSRANISEDYRLALPLVQAAVERKDYAEASALIDEAIRSRLRLGDEERWDPRAELFAHRERFYGGEDHQSLAKLLRLWQKAAKAQRQADLAAALGVHITALRGVEDGDRMLAAFREIPQEVAEVRDALFADWRKLIVEQTLETHRSDRRAACGDWVAALVDAAAAGPEGAPTFHAAVRAALAEAHAAPAMRPRSTGSYGWSLVDRSTQPLHALAILTLDLDATRPVLKATDPKLYALLSSEVERDRNGLEKTRRTFCARLGGSSLLPEILAFWRDVAVRCVPDPGDVTASYEQCADWLLATREVNPTAAAELLARWGETHRLKRNLWRDVAERGFPLPAGVRRAR